MIRDLVGTWLALVAFHIMTDERQDEMVDLMLANP